MTELEWTIGVLEELLFEERDDPESLSNGYAKVLRNAIAVLIGMNQRELADVLATTKALRPIGMDDRGYSRRPARRNVRL